MSVVGVHTAANAMPTANNSTTPTAVNSVITGCQISNPTSVNDAGFSTQNIRTSGGNFIPPGSSHGDLGQPGNSTSTSSGEAVYAPPCKRPARNNQQSQIQPSTINSISTITPNTQALFHEQFHLASDNSPASTALRANVWEGPIPSPPVSNNQICQQSAYSMIQTMPLTPTSASPGAIPYHISQLPSNSSAAFHEPIICNQLNNHTGGLVISKNLIQDTSSMAAPNINSIHAGEQAASAGSNSGGNCSNNRLADELRAIIESRDRQISELRDYQNRARESLKALLLENSQMERKNTRQRVMENRLRLGQFVAQRQGSHYEEKWVDGWRFQELERRRRLIEAEKEEIENRRRVWNKRKHSCADRDKNASNSNVSASTSFISSVSSSGSAGLSIANSGPAGGANVGNASSLSGKNVQNHHHNSQPNLDITADEFFIQAEIFDLRKQMLTKEDKEIQSEMDRLDRERNLHIREIKRIMNEDNSRFKEHPMLNDRYLLLNLLGKGGFSEVHKGYDLKEQRYVACKIHQLNPTWPKEKKDNYTKHALREIEIHKTLNHPRIVKVLDVFDIDNDAFCTVLEYIDGNDLDFHLKQNKFISERDAKSIMCQVVSALKYLNERRPPVIHYDLKPGNILLGSGSASGEIKITDFGLSKLMTEDTYAPDIGMDLTSQGAGTYWYLPPECFETAGGQPPKISSKVDVWSVGVIFYQCLFGKKPFGHNMSQADILHQSTILQAKTIHFPTCPKVSDAAKDLIRRCCTYRKETRPDVFILANDGYLKPKAQLRKSEKSPLGASSCNLNSE